VWEAPTKRGNLEVQDKFFGGLDQALDQVGRRTCKLEGASAVGLHWNLQTIDR